MLEITIETFVKTSDEQNATTSILMFVEYIFQAQSKKIIKNKHKIASKVVPVCRAKIILRVFEEV